MKRFALRPAAVLVGLSLTLAGCGTAEVAEIRGLTDKPGSQFSGALSEQYRALALYEADEMYNWVDAAFYAERGLAAGRGAPLAPTELAPWYIRKVDQPALKRARTRLIDVLDRGARDGLPETAARALTSFECWVEQAEENHQTSHIETCRHDFELAMATLILQLGERGTSLFFDFDSDRLDHQGKAALARLAEKLKKSRTGGPVTIVGHADRAGGERYNQGLSERRALGVGQALASLGFAPTSIAATGAGEMSPLVRTRDGAPMALNRRVVIFEQ